MLLKYDKIHIWQRNLSHLLLLPPAQHHPPSQEFNPFLQLLIFMSIHLPSSDLQNILTAKGCCWAPLMLQNGDKNGWQHFLLQDLNVLLGQSGLQQRRKGVTQGEPALQRTYWQFTWHESLVQLRLKLHPLRRRCVVCCCRVVSQFLF